MTVVEIRDGSVALGGRPVVRGVDLSVGDGDVLALLGTNGSGKSTLVRAMLGLVPLLRGEVTLFGDALPRFTRWSRVGYVPQRATAAGGVPATVREVVAAGRLSRRPLLRPMRRVDREAITAAIDAVGLSDRAGDGVSTLSGGQQQRVLIARALAGEPDLLVLDEPTAGVDQQSQQAFADALTALVDRGATIVLVAHELGPLAPLIGRTVVMRDGRVAYDGPPAGAHDAPHAHHHPNLPGRRGEDHVPVVGSPLDRPLDPTLGRASGQEGHR